MLFGFSELAFIRTVAGFTVLPRRIAVLWKRSLIDRFIDTYFNRDQLVHQSPLSPWSLLKV